MICDGNGYLRSDNIVENIIRNYEVRRSGEETITERVEYTEMKWVCNANGKIQMARNNRWTPSCNQKRRWPRKL
jgi:hypothetical protein